MGTKVTISAKNFKFNAGDFLKDSGEMNKVSRTIRSESVINYRQGISPKNNQRFPDLKASSVKNREYIARYNKPNAAYAANTSNITITGRFVRSFRVALNQIGITSAFAEFKLGFRGNHKRYRNSKGKLIGKKDTPNQTIANNLTSLGYKLYGVSTRAEQRIVRQFKRWVRRNLKVS